MSNRTFIKAKASPEIQKLRSERNLKLRKLGYGKNTAEQRKAIRLEYKKLIKEQAKLNAKKGAKDRRENDKKFLGKTRRKLQRKISQGVNNVKRGIKKLGQGLQNLFK